MQRSVSNTSPKNCGPTRQDCPVARPAAWRRWRTPRRGTSPACWPMSAGRSVRQPRSSVSTATRSPGRFGSTGCEGGNRSMNAGAKRSLPPLRVEQALGLLPDIEVLAPLRALLLAASRPDERDQWSSLGPYLTVGNREVQPPELPTRITHAPSHPHTPVRAPAVPPPTA